MKGKGPGISAFAAALLAAMSGSAVAEENLREALLKGKPIVDLRIRHEHMEQDGLANNAEAWTGRARLGYETGSFRAFSALADFDLVGHVGPERFNNTVNGRTTYPIVADPDVAELNRLQISWAGFPDTVVTLGRQRIVHGYGRFVGNFSFRQNEQTFDALRITNSSVDGLSLDYAYVNRVNRPISARNPIGRLRGDTHLFNANYSGLGFLTLGTYAYLLDFNETPGASTQTYGLRTSVPVALGEETKLTLTGEYAAQRDYAGNPKEFDLDYYHADVQFALGAFGLYVAYDVREGDSTRAFSMPIGTGLGFNNWSDVFSSAPAAVVNGLKDFHVGATYEITGIPAVEKLLLSTTWYDFTAERGGADMGNELFLSATFFLTKNMSLDLKHTTYNGTGTGLYADRHRSWVSLTYVY